MVTTDPNFVFFGFYYMRLLVDVNMLEFQGWYAVYTVFLWSRKMSLNKKDAHCDQWLAGSYIHSNINAVLMPLPVCYEIWTDHMFLIHM